MKNKSGVCPVCHKEFKITKIDKMVRHGYTYKRKYKKWHHGFFEIIKYHMVLINPACVGSGKKTEKIIEVKNK